MKLNYGMGDLIMCDFIFEVYLLIGLVVFVWCTVLEPDMVDCNWAKQILIFIYTVLTWPFHIGIIVEETLFKFR